MCGYTAVPEDGRTCLGELCVCVLRDAAWRIVAKRIELVFGVTMTERV